MINLLHQFILLVIFFTCYQCADVSKNYTILYDDFFTDQIDAAKSNLHNVKWESIQANSGLQSILISGTSDNVVFTFSEKINAMSTANNINFKDSLDNLEKSLIKSGHQKCFGYSPDLRRSLIALFYSIFLKEAAIVTDDSPCIIDFAKDFDTALKAHKMYDQANPTLYHVTYDPNEEINQHHKFYELKLHEVSLIILLFPSTHSHKVYQDAEHFALLTPSQLWIVPDHQGDTSRHRPAKMLTFDFERVNNGNGGGMWRYKKFGDTVQDLVQLHMESDKECQSFHQDQKDFCIQRTLFHEIQTVQSRIYPNYHLDLTIRYRNLADKQTGWINVSSEIRGDEFLVHDRNIALLKPVTNEAMYQNKITAVTIIDEPYSVKEDKSYDKINKICITGIKCRYRDPSAGPQTNGTWIISCCTGYVLELFQMVLKDLNLEVDMYVVEDGKYGKEQPNGEWDGLIGDLKSGKADIGVGSLSISGARSKVVDFTSPWLEIDLGLLVKPKISKLDFLNFEFIAPLGTDLQLVLWVTVIGVMFVVIFIENNRYLVSLSDDRFLTDKYYSPYESMSYIGGVFLQRDLGGINPKKPGARVASIVFAFGMVVVVTTYTALLVEQGVRREEKDPFVGSDDPRMRNPSIDYKFATLQSSNYETFFEKSELSEFKKVSRFMKKYNAPNSTAAIKAIKSGKLDAFLYDYDFLVWYVSRDRQCELKVRKDTLITSGLGFAFRKDFKWWSNFNQAVLRYRENDELQNIHSKWFFNGGCNNDGPETPKIRLGINHFGGLILLLIGCVVVSFPLLLPEHLYFRYLKGTFNKRIRNFFRFICCRPRKKDQDNM
ncbi:glutamate receptor ionotropic, NMDA 2B-like [Clytia hemisphaerica]